VNAGGCHLVVGAPELCRPPGDWSISDPSDDVMAGAGDTDHFGPDCRAQIGFVMGKLP
jgi:hypothetical protein